MGSNDYGQLGVSDQEENNCEDDEEMKVFGATQEKENKLIITSEPLVQKEPLIIFGLLSVKV